MVEGAGDEAPDAVVLPVGGLGDLGHRRAVLAAQEVEDDRLLAKLARYGGGLRGGFLGVLLGGGLVLLPAGLAASSPLVPFLALGAAFLLVASFFEVVLLRRNLRALFRNGGGFGGLGGFVFHGSVSPWLAACCPRTTFITSLVPEGKRSF